MTLVDFNLNSLAIRVDRLDLILLSTFVTTNSSAVSSTGLELVSPVSSCLGAGMGGLEDWVWGHVPCIRGPSLGALFFHTVTTYVISTLVPPSLIFVRTVCRLVPNDPTVCREYHYQSLIVFICPTCSCKERIIRISIMPYIFESISASFFILLFIFVSGIASDFDVLIFHSLSPHVPSDRCTGKCTSQRCAVLFRIEVTGVCTLPSLFTVTTRRWSYKRNSPVEFPDLQKVLSFSIFLISFMSPS